MSKVLDEAKKRMKKEVFKSDDGVSAVPPVEYEKDEPEDDLSDLEGDEGDSKEAKNKKMKKTESRHRKKNEEDDYEDEDEEDLEEAGYSKKRKKNEDDDYEDDEELEEAGYSKKRKKNEDDDYEDEDDEELEEAGDYEDEEEDDEDLDEKMSKKKVKKEHLDISEDLRALFGDSEETLSEEFKTRTKKLFETAVLSSANQALSEVIEELKEDFGKAKEKHISQITNKLDEYLNVVVEEWFDKNKEQIKSNSRVEIAESFLDGLKTLYEEHYISIPEDKVEVVDDLVKQVEKLEETLDKRYQAIVDLKKKNEDLEKDLIIKDESWDLSELQSEKLASLVESVDFENHDNFKEKVRELKEAYFEEKGHRRSMESDDEPILINEEEEHGSRDPEMDAFVQTIKKFSGK